MSATEAPPSGSSASDSAPVAPDPGPPRGRALTWVAVTLAGLAAFVVLTWPLALHPDHFWTMAGNRGVAAEPNFVARPGGMHGGDHLQNVFIQSVIVDNLLALRSPYLDLREGAAGPAPLKTTSLDVPWTALLAVAWPVIGLVPAYNLGLALSSVLTGLAAFAWLRRHTRWQLLAAAGALAYAFTPHRMFQLTSHFNAVMWWAFPAALLAFEVMVERRRAGRRWGWPAAGLAAITLTVAVSGEFHLILYLTGLLGYLVVWTLVASLAGRRGVPWGPLASVVVTLGVACAYVLGVFQAVFKGSVAGENGSWQQVVLYSPGSVWALVRKSFGTQGEGLIYIGWPLRGPGRARPGRGAGQAAGGAGLRRPGRAPGRAHLRGTGRHRRGPGVPVPLRPPAVPLPAAGPGAPDGGDRPGPGPAGGERPGRGRRAAGRAAPRPGGRRGGPVPGHRGPAGRLPGVPEPLGTGQGGQPGGGGPADGRGPGRAGSWGSRSWARRSPGTPPPPI